MQGRRDMPVGEKRVRTPDRNTAADQRSKDRSGLSAGSIHTGKAEQPIRWYVLTLPVSHKGYYSGNPGKGLQTELARRTRSGEPLFEYFAPSYVETREEEGKWISTSRPLLYNYVFVRASESEILRLKQFQPQYNFLPRIQDSQGAYYPYLSDESMGNLKWVARSYADTLPVCSFKSGIPMKGDRIRITEGQFKGVEAEVIIQPGGGRKTIMVCVENCIYIPLLSVEPGQYEIIALNGANRHLYTRMDGERLPNGLHDALKRYHSAEGVTNEDKCLAKEALLQYENLQMESDIMRSKLYAILLPAYTILEEKEKRDRLIETIRNIIPLLKAQQARALLWVTLYGCTNDSRYYDQAHALINPWEEESIPKKNKLRLIQRVDEYDQWFGHK